MKDQTLLALEDALTEQLVVLGRLRALIEAALVERESEAISESPVSRPPPG